MGSNGIPRRLTFPYRECPIFARARGKCLKVPPTTYRKRHQTAPSGNHNVPGPRARKCELNAPVRRREPSRSPSNPVSLPRWTSIKVVGKAARASRTGPYWSYVGRVLVSKPASIARATTPVCQRDDHAVSPGTLRKVPGYVHTRTGIGNRTPAIRREAHVVNHDGDVASGQTRK